ncbi:iron chelate uptake ABC transporter family permease subunit [Ornithinimicrobium sp. Arc0846-15]|nr:iron chelate uptake ABC transporter family permease subunit [Ornithinimicrobium laminariae]
MPSVTAARQRRLALGWLAALLLLVVIAGASVAIGARDLPLSQVWAALLDRESSDAGTLVWESRMPRTVIGLLAGLGLGVSGALIQAVTRNPLADPGILGVTAGSAFAVAIAVGILGLTSPSQFQWFAYLGALGTTVLVYLLGSWGGRSANPVHLTLAGVALGAVLSGIVTAIVLADPEGFNAMRAWESGNLQDRGWSGVTAIGSFMVVGLMVALALGPSLNAVALGDDFASALGANIILIRTAAVVAVTLLAGGATALAGPIAFVGLMIPHVARRFTGPDQRWILAYTLVLAPILLVSADMVGRLVVRPAELPVGIVTAFIGAPVLIYLARRMKVNSL